MSNPALQSALDKLTPQLGQIVGTSSWINIDQNRIDAFADITEDHQFIHIDPDRTRSETPFPDTIAHGFLTLSLASKMSYDALPRLDGETAGLNYGFEKVRFLSPVLVGSDIRGVFTLSKIDTRNDKELLLSHSLTIEIKGFDKPALVAEWLSLSIF